MKYSVDFDQALLHYGDADRERIHRASELNERFSGTALRASGEPESMHPVRVGVLLAEIGLDADSVITALLHHIPWTAENRAFVEKEFGPRIPVFLDGLWRIAEVKAKNKTIQAAETVRKILFAMIEDIRIIIIKLADKLDNMRSLKYLEEENRKRIASECIDIFAPLADRLGISWMKDELEDLSLKELNNDAYQQIKSLVQEKKDERDRFLEAASAELVRRAKDEGIEIEISARAKHFYSIYQKLRKRSKSVDEVFDLLGLRVFCKSQNDCYTVLGIIHTVWKPLDGRFKDYIAMPKSNGYQSLHTTVITPTGKILEIQIRTFEMHQIAEYGIASHWLYKKGSTSELVDVKNLPIVNKMKGWAAMLDSGEYFLQEIKQELLKDSIILFTPRGDAIELPAGSTALDFAFAVHSDVGTHCHMAKVNGSIISLVAPLENAQVVEIITSTQAHPNVNWLQSVKTSKARSKIRQWLLANDTVLAIDHNIVAGKQVAEKKTAESKKPLESPEEKSGHIPLEFSSQEYQKSFDPDKAGITVQGGKGYLIKLASCCKPHAGDEIIGYVSRGRGIIVHKKTCSNLKYISEFSERAIPVQWESMPETQHRFFIRANKTYNLFSEIDNSIRKEGGHLLEGKFEIEHDHLVGYVLISHSSPSQLKKAEKSIRSIPSVIDMQRM
jgi:GTP pyrophosphokinase